MQYILYMLNNENDELLITVLDEYNYNPFLIKLVNARDSKLPNTTADGKDNKKLVVKHPLEYVASQRTNSIASQNGLVTNVGTKPLHELVPSAGVKGVDLWAGAISNNSNDLWSQA